MKRKIIVVAYHLGRVGSSAMMGILKLGGLNVGQDSRLTTPGSMNPKGFFELKSQQHFLAETFKGFYPNVTDPPPIYEGARIGQQYYQAYHHLILAELGDTPPYAIKSQRFLTLFLLYYLKQDYDIKVIVMNRQEKEQAESFLRVWRKNPPEPSLQQASPDFVLSYIRKWKQFSLQFMEHFNFDYCPVSFEKLMQDSYQEISRVFNFIDEKMPALQSIDAWLDLSLVNRQEYQ